MAWTSSDLSSIETAILNLVSGSRAVSVTFSDGKTIRYHETDLQHLRSLRNEIRSEVNASSFNRRVYAKNGGRGFV